MLDIYSFVLNYTQINTKCFKIRCLVTVTTKYNRIVCLVCTTVPVWMLWGSYHAP